MKVKVYPYNYIDDLEHINNTVPDTEAVGIEKMSITYIQPADTCSDPEDIQTITIETECGEAAAKDRDTFYFNISIPDGGHWSVGDGEELKCLVEDFSTRLHMVTEQLK